MAIRFFSPENPTLELPGVPATFVNGICDIDEGQVEQLGRMRFLGAPYGVVEANGSVVGGAPGGGNTGGGTGASLAAVAAAIRDGNSEVGAALRAVVDEVADVEALTNRLNQLPAQLQDPGTAAGNAIRAAINSYGPKVSAGGGVYTLHKASTAFPAEAAELDLFPYIGSGAGKFLLHVRQGGAWKPLDGTGAAITPPTPPTATTLSIKSATGGDGQVTIVWESVRGTDNLNVTGVRVGRNGSDTNGSGPWSVDAAASGSQTFTLLANGTAYTLSVQLLVNGSLSGTPLTATVTPVAPSTGGGTTPPNSGGGTPTPTNPTTPSPATITVTATAGDGTATVTWQTTPGTDGATVSAVRVARDGIDTFGTGAYQADALPSGQFQFTNLVNGRTYNLSVQMLVAGQPYAAPVVKPVTPTAATTNPPPTPPTGGGQTGTGKFARYTVPARGWWSGGAGPGIDGNNPAFGTWRGDVVDAISGWSDAADGAVWGVGVLSPTGGTVVPFPGMLDLAIGGPSNYAAAAGGSLDGKLRTALTNLRKNRTIGGVLRPTVIRPFHEMNGTWYAWSVRPGGEANFRACARRWRAICNEVFPEAFWSFCPNGETTSGIQVANLYEAGVWDVIGSDRYNQFPFIGTSGGGFVSWADGMMRGSDANPVGAERWRLFAKNRGLPLYFPEYANNGEVADDPYWVNNFYPWLKANKGTGPGQIFAEMWFNIPKENNKWHVYIPGGPATRQPRVAAAYQAQFP